MNCELLNITSEIALCSSWLILVYAVGSILTAIGIVNIINDITCKKWNFKRFFKNSLLLFSMGVLFLIVSIQFSPRHVVKTFKINYNNSIVTDANNMESNTIFIEAVYDKNNRLIKINYIN